MAARFETAKERIGQYLSGEIDAIDELAEERLRFDGLTTEDPITGCFLWDKFNAIASAGVI